MLQDRDKLEYAKGKIFHELSEQHANMHTSQEGKIDYEEYFVDIRRMGKDLFAIEDLNGLERFCADYGLDETYPELSFPNLVKEAYGLG